MADKLHFTLVSPERELFSAEADQVDVPGSEGIFGVLPNHAPLMATLAAGVVHVKTGGQDSRIFVRGGFADMAADGLTVLAEEAIPLEELDREKLASKIRDAEEDVADASNDEQRIAAEQALSRLKELQAAL